MKTNINSYNSSNGSDFERLNDSDAAQEEDYKLEKYLGTSNRDSNEGNHRVAMSSYCSFAQFKCRRKRLDIYTQLRLTIYQRVLYFQYNYYSQK